jgi:predicted 3-demethylubiquinone-9 3-methyltransferase (glyoxalase superfamily)
MPKLGQKITTYLWFDDQALAAAKFYISLFPRSRIVRVTRDLMAGSRPKGVPLLGEFDLAGQRFIALNGGPSYEFTEAISLFVSCESQAEVDRLWSKLTSRGGQEGPCGWLKDRYGLSWQIVPRAFMKMLESKDRKKANRGMDAMLRMKKLDLAVLKRAFEGRGS